jgi:hypothetical protein
VPGTDYHKGLFVVKHNAPDQYSCCGACDADPQCVTTVLVFKACYLFNKDAIGQSYSRPGHGVSCQTKNYSNYATESLAATKDVDASTAFASMGGTVLARNLLPLVAPGQFELPTSKVGATVADDGTITLTATATAVYVWLSTLAQGRFSQNGMVLRPGKTTVLFVPFGELDVAGLRESLRVEHLQQHLSAS